MSSLVENLAVFLNNKSLTLFIMKKWDSYYYNGCMYSLYNGVRNIIMESILEVGRQHCPRIAVLYII